VENIADDGAGRRSDDADDRRQEGQGAFARFIEKAFGCELAAALFDERHEGADARRLERLDDDLIGGFARESRNFSCGHNFEPFLGLDLQADERALPDDCVDARVLIFQAEIGMARGMRAAIIRDFAAQANEPEPVFDRTLQGAGEFADRELGRIGWFRHAVRMTDLSRRGKGRLRGRRARELPRESLRLERHSSP